MKKSLSLALLVIFQLNLPLAMAEARRLGINISSSKADCDIITKGETLSPDKGCVFDFCFDDPNHPGKTAGCSQSCPGDPGFPSPDDPKPEPKPDDPKPPKEPEPAPEPKTPEPPIAPEPAPEPEAPEPTPTPEPTTPDSPEPSSPDGGAPAGPDTPPETPGTDGGDFECAENTNCLPPEGPESGALGPKKPNLGTGIEHLDCLDPRAHCNAGTGEDRNPSIGIKPVTDSKGKLDCSNPRVSCVSQESKEESPGFSTGCPGEGKQNDEGNIPSLEDLLSKAESAKDSLFCKQNPFALKCLDLGNDPLSGVGGIIKDIEAVPAICRINPSLSRCKSPVRINEGGLRGRRWNR